MLTEQLIKLAASRHTAYADSVPTIRGEDILAFARDVETLVYKRRSLASCVNAVVEASHQAMVAAGWWTNKQTGLDLVEVILNPEDKLQALLGGALVAQKLCLVHSEISEAMEGHRKGLKDDKLPHRSMLEVELADAVLRITDLAGALGLDLGAALEEKMAYNARREDHKLEVRQAGGGKSY